ncbi:glyoxylate/hydroxypyruvate reductase A [Breoghania sp. L-A4]|uniref:2-hydroxyacid dehydrogenase n=1 Tax=Breoghania sp. L-A4 TaxID=2304600 RepID=UPI0020C13089|nr:glyoxylate/hydroxypyruvate reductase A [Breoghania sp. L-A4]
MTVLIAIKGWEPDTWTSRLTALLPDHDVRLYPDETVDLSKVRYLFAWKPPAEIIGRLTGLEAIFSLGAGVDHLMRMPDLPDVPIVRIVDPDLTMRMTEWVTLQVLAHHRRQRLYARQQARGIWKSHSQPPASAVRVGIMGLGVLGQDAAQVLARIGFQVAGWSRTEKRMEGVETYCGADGLDDFLARTDILVNLLPLTPETTGILNQGLFNKLAHDGAGHFGEDGPALINAGRGGSQVEADIVKAVSNGTLSAATLDVFETEPLPKASPLWQDPLITVTPHIAAESDPDALSRYVAAQIRAHEAGEGSAIWSTDQWVIDQRVLQPQTRISHPGARESHSSNAVYSAASRVGPTPQP